MNPELQQQLQDSIELITNPILRILLISEAIAIAALVAAVVYLFLKYVGLVKENAETLRDVSNGLQRIDDAITDNAAHLNTEIQQFREQILSRLGGH